MIMATIVDRDERTTAVENASYRTAFPVLLYGVLAIAVYRGYRREAVWDLLALVVIASGLATFIQASQRVLTRRWVFALCVAAGVAAALAVAVILLRGA
jgi:ABC-type microcin C transport system permease subunit YejB